ncbi:putative zinc transport system zinc-binding lipoprotein AdcA [Propionispora sp. 2/2-37]|nr:putative zinc transport system zinc-binding lipoprotein AdcA [Propionispora sp. 2/2-37]
MRVMRVMSIAAIVAASFILLLAGCGKQVGGEQSGNAKTRVIATIYPVYEFARQVAGDKAEVTMLVPPGAEPHDWEPSPKDLARIKNAKLFLYHGAGMEPVEKLLTKEVLGEAKPVEVSRGIELLQASEEEHEHGHQDEKETESHEHGHVDSHVWLDPVYAQQEVENIALALIEADPVNKEYYRQRADTYKQQLAELDQAYQRALANTARRDIITSHAAFGYLSKRYHLQQMPIMGLSPDSEPTPDKMAQIVEFCREHQVKFIFFETLVSPKLAETIAKETGAGLLVLNPVESLGEQEMQEGKTYLSIMRENLANLEKALH